MRPDDRTGWQTPLLSLILLLLLLVLLTCSLRGCGGNDTLALNLPQAGGPPEGTGDDAPPGTGEKPPSRDDPPSDDPPSDDPRPGLPRTPRRPNPCMRCTVVCRCRGACGCVGVSTGSNPPTVCRTAPDDNRELQLRAYLTVLETAVRDTKCDADLYAVLHRGQSDLEAAAPKCETSSRKRE